MNAVIYARYSSAGQRDQSIEDQITACRKYAADHHIHIVGIYADHAKTGRNDNRADFQRMLKDSESGAFDVVLLWKLDRFGRNREEMTMNRIKLKKNKVRVISVMENIPETSEGVILEALMEGLAEYYSLNLSENVIRGMRSNAEKGWYNGGQIPYGYKVENKTFVPDPIEAPVVKKIFSMFTHGHTRTEIVEHLKRHGYKNRRGNLFTSQAITSMLKNRRYIGEYKFNDIIIPNHFEPLVDADVFDEAQLIIADLKNHRRRLKNCRYLLSGLIECAHCGENYVAEAGTSRNGTVHKYYACYGKKGHRNGCKNKNFKKDELENFVIDLTLKKILSDPTVVHLIAENYLKSLERINNSNDVINHAKTKLKDFQKRRDNILAAIEQGILTDSTLTRLKELEDQIAECESQIAIEKNKKPLPDIDAVEWYLTELSSANINQLGDRQKLVNMLIQKVVINDSLITVVYNPFKKYIFNLSNSCSNYKKMAGVKFQELNQIVMHPNGLFSYSFVYNPVN